jgi:hypothetical protein
VARNLDKRSGWVTFAGVVGVVVGGYNAVSGIAAIASDDTLEAQAREVLFGLDVSTWGWFWLIVGATQLLAGVLILRGNEWGRWLGVTIAAISAFITVFVVFVYPLYAIAVLILDTLILYALLTRQEIFD